jgi:hypothetical protein
MPDRSSVTKADLDAACDQLSGAVLARVTYFGLMFDGDDWDYGTHHSATMGVELTTRQDERFVVCWGDAFGHFGLELLVAPAADVFTNHPASRDFSGHPWWLPFMEIPLAAEFVWRDGHLDTGQPGPVALVLAAGKHRAWIVAAAPMTVEASPMTRGGYLLDHMARAARCRGCLRG